MYIMTLIKVKLHRMEWVTMDQVISVLAAILCIDWLRLWFAAITNNSEISGFITTEVSLSVYKSLSNNIHLVYGSAPFILSPRTEAEEVALIRNNVDVIKEGKEGDRLLNSFSNTGHLCSCSTIKKRLRLRLMWMGWCQFPLREKPVEEAVNILNNNFIYYKMWERFRYWSNSEKYYTSRFLLSLSGNIVMSMVWF